MRRRDTQKSPPETVPPPEHNMQDFWIGEYSAQYIPAGLEAVFINLQGGAGRRWINYSIETVKEGETERVSGIEARFVASNLAITMKRFPAQPVANDYKNVTAIMEYPAREELAVEKESVFYKATVHFTYNGTQKTVTSVDLQLRIGDTTLRTLEPAPKSLEEVLSIIKVLIPARTP